MIWANCPPDNEMKNSPLKCRLIIGSDSSVSQKSSIRIRFFVPFGFDAVQDLMANLNFEFLFELIKVTQLEIIEEFRFNWCDLEDSPVANN